MKIKKNILQYILEKDSQKKLYFEQNNRSVSFKVLKKIFLNLAYSFKRDVDISSNYNLYIMKIQAYFLILQAIFYCIKIFSASICYHIRIHISKTIFTIVLMNCKGLPSKLPVICPASGSSYSSSIS